MTNMGTPGPKHHCHGSDKKPIEIYMFIDPLCPECWALEPIIKKACKSNMASIFPLSMFLADVSKFKFK